MDSHLCWLSLDQYFNKLFGMWNTENMLSFFVEEMKEEYDTMGPEAAIQTTGNNGTGKGLYWELVFFFVFCFITACLTVLWTERIQQWVHFPGWEFEIRPITNVLKFAQRVHADANQWSTDVTRNVFKTCHIFFSFSFSFLSFSPNIYMLEFSPERASILWRTVKYFK